MEWRERIFSKRNCLLLIGSALALVFLFSVSVGSTAMTFQELFQGLSGNEGTFSNILWSIRIPRAVGAVLAGAALAVSGGVMQSILRNPLGSPFTLGISHASAFGASFAIIILKALTSISFPFLVNLSAFMASLVATGVVLALARFRDARPETMILTGVAMSSLFTAGTTLLQYFAEDVELASVVFWTFGDLGRISWGGITFLGIVTGASVLYFVLNSFNYSVLDSGDKTAKSLGLNVEKTRSVGMVISSLLTALTISFVGIIGFIGLVVPHIVRKVMDTDQRFVIPGSVLTGSLILLVSDTVARTAFRPVVLPVGILTSFLGAPLFIYLVIKGRDQW